MFSHKKINFSIFKLYFLFVYKNLVNSKINLRFAVGVTYPHPRMIVGDTQSSPKIPIQADPV